MIGAERGTPFVEKLALVDQGVVYRKPNPGTPGRLRVDR
jgi:hypothetical protein